MHKLLEEFSHQIEVRNVTVRTLSLKYFIPSFSGKISKVPLVFRKRLMSLHRLLFIIIINCNNKIICKQKAHNYLKTIYFYKFSQQYSLYVQPPFFSSFSVKKFIFLHKAGNSFLSLSLLMGKIFVLSEHFTTIFPLKNCYLSFQLFPKPFQWLVGKFS